MKRYIVINNVFKMDFYHHLYCFCFVNNLNMFNNLKKKYNILNIILKNNNIFVNIENTWVNLVIDNNYNDVIKFLDNYILFKKKEKTLNEKWRGSYLLVNNKDEIYIYETEGSAYKAKKDKNSFLGKIEYIECIKVNDK